jgi:ribosomal protein S18 acetylase RimI-like enzyme
VAEEYRERQIASSLLLELLLLAKEHGVAFLREQ